MSSDSDTVDNPQPLDVKRRLFPKRKVRQNLSLEDIEQQLGASSEDEQYDSDRDPEFTLPSEELLLMETLGSKNIIVNPVPQGGDAPSFAVASTSFATGGSVNTPTVTTSATESGGITVTVSPCASGSGVSDTITLTVTPGSGGTDFGTPTVTAVSGGSDLTPTVTPASGGGSEGQQRRSITPKVGRKRGRAEDLWKQNIAKKKRQQGQEYVSVKTKKTVPARKPGPPCKDGCLLRVPEECRNAIFKNCWDIGSYDARLSYYNSCVSERQFKRKYTAKATSLRPMKIVFQVKSRGVVYELCRAAFQSIHGMTEKEMTVFLRKRKTSPTGALASDLRGKHEPGFQIRGTLLDRVHEHIQMLAVTSSHYSRIKNPHRQYSMHDGLSIPILYGAYQEWMFENFPGEQKVLFSFYKHIFTTCYNIAFKSPQTDVCNECTMLKEKIKSLRGKEGCEEELQEVEENLQGHTSTARTAQELLRDQGTDADDDLMVIAVDLQQTLPCPKSNINRAYYMRKLWLYNLCIYDVKAKKPTLYLWDETQGGRGADDIASCIHRWITENSNGRKKLRIFSDNCAAQNKNRTLVMMALQKVQQKILDRVEFIYLVSGHSYLPCDRIFGNIEKKLRTLGNISSPEMYKVYIESATKVPLQVIRMQIADFLAFSALDSYCKWNTPGGNVRGAFQKARQLVVTKDYPSGYLVKLHYSLHETARNHFQVSLSLGARKGKGRGKGQSRGRPPVSDFNFASVDIHRRYPGDVIKVNENKLRDLRTLMPFLPETGQQWVQSVLDGQASIGQAQGHAEEEEEDDPDPDNVAMDYEAVRCTSDP